MNPIMSHADALSRMYEAQSELRDAIKRIRYLEDLIYIDIRGPRDMWAENSKRMRYEAEAIRYGR